MYRLINDDNLIAMNQFRLDGIRFYLIYSDMIYEDEHFYNWVDLSLSLLKPNAIFQVQTDLHTIAQMKCYLDDKCKKSDLVFLNKCIFINDWGGTPRRGFPNKYDEILIYANGNNWKWNKECIQIPKVTAGTKFDKKGTGLKTPCDVFYDHASFSTISKERIKAKDGHNLRWQKPGWLMQRLVEPFTSEGDVILDNFMGSASLGEWCIRNNRNYVGIELDTEVFEIAKNRLDNL